mgnify:CR=1 FL=1
MSNPFIKVTWEDVPENFTPERIKRVKSYIEKKYNAKSVQVITKNLTHVQNTRLQSLEASDNILDPVYQKQLMKDFIKDNSIDIKWDLVERLDNRVNSKIAEANKNQIRYNKWYIKRIEFSNFLSFGDDNVIDFTQLDGISVIESTPKNFGGKSTSSVDLLMFLFFNATTKTKTNAEIFNKFTDKDDVTHGLRLGADDYVRKPFSVEELILRVENRLKRDGKGLPEIISCGPITLNDGQHRVTFKDKEIDLSPTEFNLLLVLLQNQNRVLSKEKLLDVVWGMDFETTTNVVDTYISYLRKKLHIEGFEGIKTVRGVGFKLESE